MLQRRVLRRILLRGDRLLLPGRELLWSIVLPVRPGVLR
jgi:hypothetical protein